MPAPLAVTMLPVTGFLAAWGLSAMLAEATPVSAISTTPGDVRVVGSAVAGSL